MAKKKKAEIVEKVSSETGVDADLIKRLPVKAIEKLDELVADEGEEQAEAQSPKGAPKKVEDSGKVKVGHHPLSKEPVYK